MASGSVGTTTRGFAFCDAYEAQRRMLRWGQQFTLEREQPTSNDIGFADIQVSRQAVEALTLVTDEIDLNWHCFSNAPFRHDKCS